MFILRLTSLIFALGLLVSRLFAADIAPEHSQWDDSDTRTYKVQPFTSINLEGGFKVILEQGSQPGLRIRTDEENFKYISVQSDSQSLNLKITKKHFNFDELVLYITFKDLEKLDIQGGINLETKGYVELKDFYLHVSGGADIEMEMKANRVRLVGEGGVKIEFNGVADELYASISGAGYLNANDFKTKHTDCRIEGACAACVYATETLNASIAGVGKISYKGNPQVYKKVEGLGLVSSD
ncbi:MAG: head GIN domain-containing protein [Candidatus Saccharibacteria bacterium]